MTTLILARHGETDWNRDHLWQGHTGPPLNHTGRRQAAELAGLINDIDAVYSSDAERAYETALILAERHGLKVRTDVRLREVNFGDWEGLTRAQINDRFSGAFTKWLTGETSKPTGGEADERWQSVSSSRSPTSPSTTLMAVSWSSPAAVLSVRLRRICLGSIRQRRARLSRRFPTARLSNS